MQVNIHDLRISRQRNKHARSAIVLRNVDLSALGEFFPAGRSQDLTGKISGEVQLADFPFVEPAKARGKLTEFSAVLEQGNLKLSVLPVSEALVFNAGNIDLSNWTLRASYAQFATDFKVSAHLNKLAQDPSIEAQLQLQPIDLSVLKAFFPRAEVMSGELTGNLQISGALGHPRTEGMLQVKGAELQLRGLDWPITNANLGITIRDGEVRLSNGEANLGTGRIRNLGRRPVRWDATWTSAARSKRDGRSSSVSARLEGVLRLALGSRT